MGTVKLKKKKKKDRMAPDSTSGVIQVSQETPESPDWFEKILFTPSTRSRAHARTSDRVPTNASSLAATINILV